MSILTAMPHCTVFSHVLFTSLLCSLLCSALSLTVYRVLTEQEIQLWDSFTEEHANDELTSLGLKRRQEQLLLNAGLLYNFTKDELLKETPPTQASSESGR